MLTTILIALASLLPTLLTQFGVNASIDNLIAVALQAAMAIFSAIKTGTSTQADILAVLTVLQTTLAAVEADTSIDPQIVDDTAEGVRVLKAAIAGYQGAMLIEDTSTLTPLPLVE